MGAAKKAVNDAKGGVNKTVSGSNPQLKKLNDFLKKNTGLSIGDSVLPTSWTNMLGFDAQGMKDFRKGETQEMLKSLGVDPQAVATAVNGPKFTSMTDDKGRLLAQYKMPGDAVWRKNQLARQALEEKNALGGVTQGALGQRAAAETALAARGGMQSGARERLIRDSMRNNHLMQQGVRNQGQLARLGIESDAFDKQQAATQANINTLMQNNQNQNAFEANKYNEQMRAWAAGKQAKATAESGGKK